MSESAERASRWTAVLWEDDRVFHLERRIERAALVAKPEAGVTVVESDRFDLALPPDVEAYLRSNRHAGMSELDRLFVASIDGEVAGITALGRGTVRCHGRRATVRLGDELGYSYATFVSGRARGRGVGSVLLESMLARAAALGLRKVYAIIQPANAPSLRLYERSGFAVTGEWRFRRVLGIRRVDWIPAAAASPPALGRAGEVR